MLKAILLFLIVFASMIFMVKRRWSYIFRNDLPIEIKVLLAIALSILVVMIPQYFSTANVVVDPFK